jgi:hypothetical protein
MTACQIQRGLFTLRNCVHEATDTCKACGKGICQEHTVFSDLKPHCPACHGKVSGNPESAETLAPDSAPSSAASAAPTWNRPGFSQNWRDRYYHDIGYIPYYANWDRSHYSDSDRSGFATQAEKELDSDANASDGFSDS